ncbi:SRPBCC family protein [Saccharopolyspora erythraea]|uniref:SRPBCC family protein n=1 Tax=Saccharopolyspora erythraea TaxID=1836 RepID=UPI002011A6BF|nr:SRPBCC family protein [Saccharopolyspora erythraea]
MAEPERAGRAVTGDVGKLLQDLPLDPLKSGLQDLLGAVAERAAGVVTDKVEDMTERLTESAGNGGAGLLAAVTGGTDLASGKSPVSSALSAGLTGAKEKVKQAVGLGGGGKGGKKGKAKVVNIIETNDIGLPLRVVYDKWTQFEDFPDMTKKVESVDQQSDETVNWRARIFFSRRNWEATIVEQVPDSHIVWTSKGAKGTVDGSVSFHELAPNMTRVLLVVEYYPQGFFEKTANLWRAQGRRVRADFKYIKRHMMTRTILEQGEIEGWRGEIRDREVVKTHDDALAEEQERESGYEDEDRYREDYGDEEEDYGDEEDEDRDEDRDEEDEEEDRGYDDETGERDRYDEEEEYAEEEPADEEEDRSSRRQQPTTSGRRR